MTFSVIDIGLGVAAIVAAPSLVAEVVLLPAELASIYGTLLVLDYTTQAAKRPCNQIRVSPVPFSGR